MIKVLVLLTILAVTFQKPVTCTNTPSVLETVFEEVDCTDRKVCFVDCSDLVEGCKREIAFEAILNNRVEKKQYSRMCTNRNREILSVPILRELTSKIPNLEDAISAKKPQIRLEEICHERKNGNRRYNPSGICSPFAIFRLEIILKQMEKICQEKPEMKFNQLVLEAIAKESTPNGRLFMMKKVRANPTDNQYFESVSKRLIDLYQQQVLNKKQKKCDCLDGFGVAILRGEEERQMYNNFKQRTQPIIRGACEKVCPPGKALNGFTFNRRSQRNRRRNGERKKKKKGGNKNKKNKKVPKKENTQNDRICLWRKYKNGMKAFLCD